MKTVKEISKLTGISVRTLHYYDEIGLLKPTEQSEAGYRLYDDKALAALQQILFFREFDMPLKEIKAILQNPEFDRGRVLRSQRRMLELKKKRLERLLSSMDDILKGDNKLDFEVFSKTEIEDIYQKMIGNAPEEIKNSWIEEFGDMDKFHEHYVANASGEQSRKNYQKMVEWYGDKESALEAAAHPTGQEVLESYQTRMDGILRKLAGLRSNDVSSFEVKSLIGEYGFLTKQLFQMEDGEGLLLDMAELYEKDEKASAGLDSVYGDGTAEYFATALKKFYNK